MGVMGAWEEGRVKDLREMEERVHGQRIAAERSVCSGENGHVKIGCLEG